MVGAVRVPDGAVDPFRLTAANVIDAKAHGAEVLTYHEVLDFLREQNRITGVKVLDRKTARRPNTARRWWSTRAASGGTTSPARRG